MIINDGDVIKYVALVVHLPSQKNIENTSEDWSLGLWMNIKFTKCEYDQILFLFLMDTFYFIS